jgi:excinuclease ABC subunit C
MVRLLETGAEPYVSKSANLRRRLERLLGQPEPNMRRLNLRERATTIEYTPTGSDFESQLLLYRLLRDLFPATYGRKLRLAPPPLIKLNLDTPFPRAYVTRRLGDLRRKSRYYGPFATRSGAEKFLSAALDLFKTRRCTFDLAPDPAFPGCVYSEMKMCLAPCFKGCTDEQYHSEVVRLEQFLESGGLSLRRELEQQRERLSESMEFEAASAIHARLEKLAATRALVPEYVRRLDQLSAVMVQPAVDSSADAGAVMLFRVQGGMIAAPHRFGLRPHAMDEVSGKTRKPQSMESRLQEALAQVKVPRPASASELMEHLALLRRWLFRTRRTGEIFMADENGALPMRRLVRGISRVLTGERPEEDASESAAKEYWLARTREDSPPSHGGTEDL